MFSLPRNATIRFFVGAIVVCAAAGLLVRVPRQVSLCSSNAISAKARRTEIASERVASAAPSAYCASEPAAQSKSEVGFEPSNLLAWTVLEAAATNVGRVLTNRGESEQSRLVLRC